MANHKAMVTAAVPKLLAYRAPNDPLSELISEGISAGNSILSGLLPGDGQTTSSVIPSRTPAASSATTTPLRFSEHSTRVGPGRSTSLPGREGASKSTVSDGNSNNHLVIILGVVIGTLVALLVALAIWILLRRRKRKRLSVIDERKGSVESGEVNTESSRSQNQALMNQYDVPQPSATLIESSRRRSHTPYWSPTETSSSEDPFLTPPLVPDNSYPFSPHALGTSSNGYGTPREQVSPRSWTRPVEIDGATVPGLPRKSSQRSRVYYPSAAEISRFDFGLNQYPSLPGKGKNRPASHSIPRKPVGL